MGQHKTNPKAIAAKNGEIPPKKRVIINNREREAIANKAVKEALHKYGIPTAEDLLGYKGPY